MIRREVIPSIREGDLADTLMVTADKDAPVMLSLFGATCEMVKLTVAETHALIRHLHFAIGVSEGHPALRKPGDPP